MWSCNPHTKTSIPEKPSKSGLIGVWHKDNLHLGTSTVGNEKPPLMMTSPENQQGPLTYSKCSNDLVQDNGIERGIAWESRSFFISFIIPSETIMKWRVGRRSSNFSYACLKRSVPKFLFFIYQSSNLWWIRQPAWRIHWFNVGIALDVVLSPYARLIDESTSIWSSICNWKVCH